MEQMRYNRQPAQVRQATADVFDVIVDAESLLDHDNAADRGAGRFVDGQRRLFAHDHAPYDVPP